MLDEAVLEGVGDEDGPRGGVYGSVEAWHLDGQGRAEEGRGVEGAAEAGRADAGDAPVVDRSSPGTGA